MNIKHIAIMQACCQTIGLQTFGDLQKFIQKHAKNGEHLLYTFIRYLEGAKHGTS